MCKTVARSRRRARGHFAARLGRDRRRRIAQYIDALDLVLTRATARHIRE